MREKSSLKYGRWTCIRVSTWRLVIGRQHLESRAAHDPPTQKRFSFYDVTSRGVEVRCHKDTNTIFRALFGIRQRSRGSVPHTRRAYFRCLALRESIPIAPRSIGQHDLWSRPVRGTVCTGTSMLLLFLGPIDSFSRSHPLSRYLQVACSSLWYKRA